MIAIGQHYTGPIAVNFTYATGVYHELTPRPWSESMAYDLGHHSAVPFYEGQWSTEGCDWIDSPTCYYDGSSMQADAYLDALNRSGVDVVWAMLDARLAEFSHELTANVLAAAATS